MKSTNNIKNPYSYKTILDYIFKELPEDKEKEFNDHLEKDEKLSDIVDGFMDLILKEKLNRQGLEEYLSESKNKFLSNISDTKEYSGKIKTGFFYNKKYLVAASFVILICIGSLFFILRNETYSNDELFSMYYQQPDDIVNFYKSESSEPYIDNLINQKLESSVSEFKKDSTNIEACYLSGIYYIQNERYSDAINSFLFIIDHNKNLYVEEAEWYLALCYIKLDQYENARIYLKEIVSEKGFKKVEAKELLRKTK